ncbi:MAG: hypothetical protein K1X74_01400 [Pirellulales bacterium]|nr:hypothetical protein [Pirellulales bacterium]
MSHFANHFSRWHFRVLIALWLLFTGLTLYIVSVGLDKADRSPGKIVATTAATVLGPMTGAISRNCQSCCLEFSLALLPYCGAALAMAALIQFAGRSEALWLRLVRLTIWTMGLVVWFGGGIISFGHALS